MKDAHRRKAVLVRLHPELRVQLNEVTKYLNATDIGRRWTRTDVIAECLIKGLQQVQRKIDAESQEQEERGLEDPVEAS